MDGFLKLGQQAYQQYSDKQSHGDEGNKNSDGEHVNVMGGAHLNRPADGQMIDTDGDGIPDLDQAAAHASGHSGNSGDSSLFSTAVSFLKSQSHQSNDDEIDVHKVTEAHDRAYNQNQGASLDAKSMGAAAALQAFKQFSSHGGGASSNNLKSDQDGQSKLIGMAMAQAAKLFDSSGGAAGEQKQDAVNSAGKMIMKLIMKQKVQQMSGGGGGGGGLGGLASMIGKFA